MSCNVAGELEAIARMSQRRLTQFERYIDSPIANRGAEIITAG